jgi:pyruvate dehydrogenase E1 component alpha subunit
MDFFNCYAGFKDALEYVLKTSRPVLIEAITDRFRGHSISDPAVYRSKEHLQKTMNRDPILLLKTALIEQRMLTEDEFKEMDKKAREVMVAAMQFAEESPWPDVITLEEGVFAPEGS